MLPDDLSRQARARRRAPSTASGRSRWSAAARTSWRSTCPKLEAAEWPAVNRERLEATAREWGLELGRGFRIAAEALGSSVERVECHVQELARERIGGPVDFVFSGAILLHLRDPVGALENIHSVLEPGGTLVILEPFSPRTTIRSPRGPVADFQPLSTPVQLVGAEPGRRCGRG